LRTVRQGSEQGGGRARAAVRARDPPRHRGRRPVPAPLGRAVSVSFPILLAIIATPAIGAVITLLVPARRPEIVKAVGYAFTTATAGVSAYLLWNFKVGPAGFKFVENRPWIPGLGARFIVGVDGINLFMVVVT